jgi:MFS transporter, OPA family, glycerol-3-phosphate transporter
MSCDGRRKTNGKMRERASGQGLDLRESFSELLWHAMMMEPRYHSQAPSAGERSVLNPRYERWRWLTFAITWLIYAGFYITRQAFSVAKAELVRDPQVSLERSDLGWVDSSYSASYMLGQFIFGPLGDRFGPRQILLMGMGLSILAIIASGFSTTLAAFVAFAIVQGIAQSTGWSNTTKVMSSWFSVGERGRVIGWWCTHYTVGAAVAAPFAGAAMMYFGEMRTGEQLAPSRTPYWPAGFWATAGALAVVWFLAWLVLRNRPEDVGLAPIEEYHGEPLSLLNQETQTGRVAEGSWKLIGEVLTTPSVWLLAVAYFPVKLARYSFYFWGPLYVKESLNFDIKDSALTVAAMPIGGLVGVIVIGYISDKLFQARRAPATILSILATAGIIVLGLTPIHNVWLMAGFFFLIGAFLFGPDSMISATASMDFGTKRGAGTATGFVNGIGSAGQIVAGFLPGVITTASDWTPMFYVMLIGLVISAAVLLPMWRLKPPTA